MSDSLKQQIAIYQQIVADANKTISGNVQTPASQNSGAETATTPSIEESAAEIKRKVFSRTDQIEMPARYIKPAFFLNEMTPTIHARVHMKRRDGSPLVYDLFDQYTNPETNTLKPIHNYIKSFEWDIMHREDAAMLEVVDVDAYFLEELVMRMTAMSRDPNPSSIWDGLIYIEVEYG